MPKDTDDPGARNALSRRSLFKQLGLAGAAAAVSGTPLAPSVAAPATPAAPAPMPTGEALETLTAAEADALEAIVARLIPTDENGPGATEARAAHYIDRALAGPLASSRAAYALGLAAIDEYAQASRGAPFSKLLRRGSGRGTAGHGEEHRHRLRTKFLGVLRNGPDAHASGHVLRPVLRRQCELRGMGLDRLSRDPHGGQRG